MARLEKRVDTEEEEEEYQEQLEKAATAQLLVAMLITTVTFAAGITMPGGFVGKDASTPPSSHPGSAILRNSAAFMAFVIFDNIMKKKKKEKEEEEEKKKKEKEREVEGEGKRKEKKKKKKEEGEGEEEYVKAFQRFPLDVTLEGLKYDHPEKAYEIKTWPVVKGFDYGEALVYLLGDAIIAADAPRKISCKPIANSFEMGYRKTSRNQWVPKRQASDEDEDVDDDKDVAKAENEPEGEEVNAEAIQFDVDTDLVDDPPIIPSPTRVPDPTSSFDTWFTAFE
ncbi:hypothetical protein CJ030_MR1G014056 [Morella rubra]|uniref:PGG domain-containing protein n=1 Tax=Morella rubra TaxID=262757 RepID=A0A6A1WMT4_9ROSI|nr:hypothetical protein CJ030_MR1G014056 [Morella rubra]